MALQILMHEAFSDQDVLAVRRIAEEYDRSAEVSASYGTKAVDPVLVIMVIGGLFAQGFIKRAGEHGYDGLRDFVKRLRSDVEEPSEIILEDDQGLRVTLGLSTPAEALLDLPDDVREAAGEAGELYWDSEEGRWRPPW